MAINALIFGLLLQLAVQPAVAGSARMHLDVAPGVVAEAEYWPGSADRAAILVLHGFLQTHDFPTVRRLAEALADEGYNVLLPTLSLGVDRRRQSLPCEAIHLHSLEADVAELAAWSRWLVERAGKPPVLIGHSVGGVQLTALLDTHRELQFAGLILISLAEFDAEQNPEQLASLRARATADLARDPNAVAAYALSYCKRYVTTPAGLLSYLAWDSARLQDVLLRLNQPVTVIFGLSDDRIDAAWLASLGDAGVALRAVAGADHFFSSTHEFDLLDEVLDALSEVAHG